MIWSVQEIATIWISSTTETYLNIAYAGSRYKKYSQIECDTVKLLNSSTRREYLLGTCRIASKNNYSSQLMNNIVRPSLAMITTNPVWFSPYYACMRMWLIRPIFSLHDLPTYYSWIYNTCYLRDFGREFIKIQLFCLCVCAKSYSGGPCFMFDVKKTRGLWIIPLNTLYDHVIKQHINYLDFYAS